MLFYGLYYDWRYEPEGFLCHSQSRQSVGRTYIGFKPIGRLAKKCHKGINSNVRFGRALLTKFVRYFMGEKTK